MSSSSSSPSSYIPPVRPVAATPSTLEGKGTSEESNLPPAAVTPSFPVPETLPINISPKKKPNQANPNNQEVSKLLTWNKPSNLKPRLAKKSRCIKSYAKNFLRGKHKMITIGAPVARSFKTWPCSRKIGDPPVLVEFRGLVTEINPVTRKVHALFENGCTLVCPPSQMEPFLLKRNAPVSCAIPKYLKKILADSDDSDLSDSDEEQEDEKKEEDREEAEEKKKWRNGKR